MIDLPTHLDVGDTPYWGLSFGQILLAFGGFALGFVAWRLLPAGTSLMVHLAVAGGLLASGVLLAVVRPAGTSLLGWVTIVHCYVRTPKVTLWRP